MKKAIFISAATLMAAIASPALADDMGVDTDSMIAELTITQYSPVDIPAVGFDLSENRSTLSFMATMADKHVQNYRLKSFRYEGAGSPASPGIAALFIPEEYAFRSNAQDSGVDAVTPGRFLSSSVRSDFASDSGPAAFDKSSVGVRFGF